MLREKDIGLSDQQNHFIDDHNDPEVPVERTSDFTNRFQTIQAIQELQMQHSRRSKGNSQQNLQAVHIQETLQQMLFFHRTFVHFNYPSNVVHEALTDQGGLISKFTGFKWNPRSSRSGSIVEEVRNPTGSLMEMCHDIRIRNQCLV